MVRPEEGSSVSQAHPVMNVQSVPSFFPTGEALVVGLKLAAAFREEELAFLVQALLGAPVQDQPVSIVQDAEHPSVATAFPSSQISPDSIIPFPQGFRQMPDKHCVSLG